MGAKTSKRRGREPPHSSGLSFLEVKEEKQRLRRRIWRLLEQRQAALFPFPVWGRMPNFVGSDVAAERLRQLKEWAAASVVFCNPDYAQKPVRERVLKDGKALLMATPRLKAGFLFIPPRDARGRESYLATIKGAFRHGTALPLERAPKPDLLVTGCVAVDLEGFRLGKGGGYGDREIREIQERFGRILVVTTVHDLQVVDKVPVEKGDVKVDIIVTPTQTYRVDGKES
ncbi:5-formyltetrahydrofolate cyclo-ligase [Candidatus Hecatella orcuttiae]|uniref:5-formyltetrahydrofolate cyclo-ligase n=1 Tax=Candidatus Hecatella orcuttiae TaxID=1935119 RepID=UPI002867C347|nr:5-formyltetrahydrofolate cyclo-ligase [Candidatus Hecatella orcuttiae]